MKFSFCHITDIHIGQYQGRIEAGGMNSRFLDFVNTYNESIDYAVKNKVDFCLLTGDLFKHKDPQPYEINALVSGFRKLMNAKIPVYIILGNHDLFLTKSMGNSISFLDSLQLDGVYISSHPELIYFNTKDGDRICIQTMPYQHMDLLDMKSHQEVSEYMQKTINEQYAKIEKDIPCIFGGHFSLTDAKIGSEQKTINRFNEPIVNKDIFKGKNYIYAAMGHLHAYQIVMKSPPVVYGGSINRTDFNEWKEDKGFVACKYNDGIVWEFIKVGARKFVDFEFDKIEDENPTQTVIDFLKSREGELKNAIVRISVNISEANKNNYNSIEIMEYLNSVGAEIHGTTSPHIIKNEEEIKIEFTEKMDCFDVMKKYSELNASIVEKELFLTLAQEIIFQTKNREKKS